MQVTVKGKQFDVSDSLKAYASEKVQKITRYFDSMVSADVTLTTERNWHVAQVTVFGEGFDLRGEEQSKDMYNSIDRVMDKLEQQAKRQKAKVADHRKRQKVADVVASVPESKISDSSSSEVDPYAPRLDEKHSFVAEEMTLEQAIKALDAQGLNFFVFLNSENGRINVVYETDKGFGLVDPRLES